MLELNSSLFFVTFLIIVLSLLLERIYFRPIARILTDREKKIATDTQTLNVVVEEIHTHTQTMEVNLQSAQRDASRIKEDIIANGETLRRQMVEEARGKSQILFREKMAEMETQIAIAAKDLESQVDLFSRRIRESVL